MSNQSKPKLYKEILETIRMTLPEKYRPESYSDISGAINLWMESKQKELERAHELRESAQAVTRKIQDTKPLELSADQIREMVLGEMSDALVLFRHFTRGRRIIIEDGE